MEPKNVRILRLDEVLSRVGLRRSTVYLKITLGEFPRPIPLGGKAVGWLDYEIEHWFNDRIKQREGKEDEKETSNSIRGQCLRKI